ncbi:MAG: LCP family protein [Lachnospiraceae bacterium]
MKNKNQKIDQKNRNYGETLQILVLILIPVVALGVVWFCWNQSGGKSTSTTENAVKQEETTEKWQESEVVYQGRSYRYNQQMKTYLIMGIDQNGPVEEAENAQSGGQADAIFLLAVDEANKKTSMISVHRNTMTEIETYTEEGIKAEKTTAQICTQHGFGDGKRWSCNLMVNAVSKLFYELPIKGYLSFRLDAVPIMNDEVGGVGVTILEDVEVPEEGVSLQKGDTVILNGTQAYHYLRGRNVEEFDSATGRLQRQVQYLGAYGAKLKEVSKDDPEKVYEIYDRISPYVVSNIDFPELVEELKECGQEMEQYSVPGKTEMGEQFEEFHVEEQGLYELILKVFYEEVK